MFIDLQIHQLLNLDVIILGALNCNHMSHNSHNILLSKLRRLGLASHCLLWFSSYVSDRTQRVRYGDAVSQMLTLTHGVPQGSILGPVLFTTYIDGLINLVTHSQVSCYVDDSQLYLKFQVSNVHNAIATVNADLQEICKWCARNSLLLIRIKPN